MPSKPFNAGRVISELLPLQKPAEEAKKVVKKVSKDVNMLFGDLKSKGAQNYKKPRQIAENELDQYLSVDNTDFQMIRFFADRFSHYLTLAMNTLCILRKSVPCEMLFF